MRKIDELVANTGAIDCIWDIIDQRLENIQKGAHLWW